MSSEPLLIIGASARAAAFSALRAGLQPWCVDLFADADLQQRCPATRLQGRYPWAFLEVVQTGPPGPWLYTGGLENWPFLVFALARHRPLWGNNRDTLHDVRNRRLLAHVLTAARFAVPRLSIDLPADRSTRWLVKPWRGAGGMGIHRLEGAPAALRGPRKVFYQQYVEGESWAGLYVGNGEKANFLGATRQLVGEPWLNAAPFHYCGSTGPIFPIASPIFEELKELGTVLAHAFGLRGLFGVDGVVCDNRFWTVEVNPRYTASVEVHEYWGGPTMMWHQLSFQGSASPWQGPPLANPRLCIGKAILFAREPLNFPASGPWDGELQHPTDIHEVPAFADIPHAGERIEARRPILTFFARAGSEAACLDTLKQIARELNGWLFGSP